MDGWADVFTIAPLKAGAETFTLTISPEGSGSWSGGVVLSFDDSSNWTALVAGADGRLSTFEVEAGEAWWWDQAEAPDPVDGAYRFEVAHDETASEILINGEALTLPLDFAPTGGPALNAAALRFTEIAWQ